MLASRGEPSEWLWKSGVRTIPCVLSRVLLETPELDRFHTDFVIKRSHKSCNRSTLALRGSRVDSFPDSIQVTRSKLRVSVKPHVTGGTRLHYDNVGTARARLHSTTAQLEHTLGLYRDTFRFSVARRPQIFVENSCDRNE